MTDEPAWMKPRGEPWRTLSSVTVYDNPWIKVEAIDAVAPTGNPALYGRVGFKNRAIGVLPLFDDATTVLVGQHRFPTGDYSWELPEGGGPMDEDPERAARRELAEEAGLQAAHWRLIVQMELSNSVTDEEACCYLATGLSPVLAEETDPTEDLQVVRVPFREALEQVLAGRIRDSLTVAMLLRAYYMAREGEIAPDLARRMLG